MKNKIYVNRRSGCGVRILVNPKGNFNEQAENVAINPDTSHLKGVSFDCIKVVNGRLVKTDRQLPQIAKSKAEIYLKRSKAAWRKRVVIDLFLIVIVLYSIRFHENILEWIR